MVNFRGVESGAAKHLGDLPQAVADKEAEVQNLQSRLEIIDVSQKLTLSEAVSRIEKQRDELKSGLVRSARNTHQN